MNLRLALLGSMFVIGCGGGDSRPATAPELPEPFLDAPCTEYDSGADGTVDIVYMYTYNSDGFVTHETSSTGTATDYTYDDDNFVVALTENIDTDAGPEYEQMYTRDADGRVVNYVETDGTMPTTTIAYTYDSKGRITTETVTDANGMATSTFMYTGDHINPSTGRTVRAMQTVSYVYTSSSDDRTLHTDADIGEDGTVDATIDTTYDAKHRQLTNVNKTGTQVTNREATTYTKSGFSATYVQADHDGGQDDYSYTATFNGSGLMQENEASSPSGKYTDYAYREVAKDACAMSRTAGVAPRAARRHRPELPFVPVVR